MTKETFKPHNIAVYGTLREGFGNHKYLLSHCKKVKTSKTEEKFTMHSYGGFPAITPNGQHDTNIVVEIFKIPNEQTANSIDRLEGYPGWYSKMEVTVDGEKVPIYYMAKQDIRADSPIVESGDWKEYVNKKE